MPQHANQIYTSSDHALPHSLALHSSTNGLYEAQGGEDGDNWLFSLSFAYFMGRFVPIWTYLLT